MCVCLCADFSYSNTERGVCGGLLSSHPPARGFCLAAGFGLLVLGPVLGAVSDLYLLSVTVVIWQLLSPFGF